MNKIEYKLYTNFKNDKIISESKIPKSILKSSSFNQLLAGNIITSEKVGRGRQYIIVNELAFNSFFDKNFNNEFDLSESRINNTLVLRNSKSGKTKTNNVFFTRGFKTFKINDLMVDLENYTSNFGLFAFSGLQNILTDKICFVENLECFFKAENLLGSDYIFIHKYGRIGNDDFINFIVNEFLVFNDFDLVGLNEFLKIKEQIGHAKLFIPNNLEALFNKFSAEIKPGSQKQTDRITNSKDVNILMIRDLVITKNRILEQEALFNNTNYA